MLLADILPSWFSFSGLWKAFLEGVKHAWEWLRDLIWGLLHDLFAAFSSALSSVGHYMTELVNATGSFSEYLAMANAWVPVDLFFQLLTAYSTFWLALLIYRTVKSWIPTVSGS